MLASLALLLSTPAVDPAPEAEAGGTFAEVAALTALDGGAGDQFGRAVAIDGDTVVVGALPPGGSAYVFQRAGSSWSSLVEVAKLTPSDPAEHDGFGEVVEIDGDTIVVGAELTDSTLNPGAAYVFVRPVGGWASGTETAKLLPSDPGLLDGFGLAVAVSGDTIAVGAPQTIVPPPGDRGKVYVYEKPPGGWANATETVKLELAAPGVRLLGHALSLEGDTLLVGSPGTTVGANAAQGAAFLFTEPPGGWASSPEALALTASDGAPSDRYGSSVDVDGDGETVVVGAQGPSPASSGGGYVFTRPPGGWASGTETAKLTSSDGERLGYSFSISGDTIVGGAQNADIGGNVGQGAAYVFLASGGVWTSANETSKHAAALGEAGEGFGEGIAVSGQAFVAGARYATVQGQIRRGRAHVFATERGSASYCTAGISASGCTATLSASGSASASAPSGFSLLASSVEGQKDGLFFFGTAGRQANPWGNGTSYQCVVPPVVRGGLLGVAGTAGQCDGAFAQDLNALWTAKPTKNPGAGVLVQAQLWYRDPKNTSNQTTSLSDAVEFAVAP